MFDWRKKGRITEVAKYSKEQNNVDNGATAIGAGFSATQVAQEATLQAGKVFAKPDTYAGNRILYDNGAAKLHAKKVLFADGKQVIDPYTGETLVLQSIFKISGRE